MRDLGCESLETHQTGEPSILYFGTPVVLISSINQDGGVNLAPMSSAFWLGWRCVLGLGASSKTTENLRRSRECVLNLPSANQAGCVNRLALTTGSDPVPEGKRIKGYRSERNKFGVAELTAIASHTIRAPRAAECPVQLEAQVVTSHELAAEDDEVRGRSVIFELCIQRVHLARSILLDGDRNRVDPDKWRPLIMSFQSFYGLAANQVCPSTLAQVPEVLYRSPDVDRARTIGLRNAEMDESRWTTNQTR